MELWDIYDDRRRRTGRVIERGKPMKQGEYHLVVHVWIKNSKGEYLISKRTPNKTFPNMWESVGGSALVGENSFQAALREVQEEIGISLTPGNGQCVFKFKRQTNFLDVYLFKEDVDITKVCFQPDEVCGAKWASPETIRKMIAEGEFVSVFAYLNDLFG